jgi:hypothetical protein
MKKFTFLLVCISFSTMLLAQKVNNYNGIKKKPKITLTDFLQISLVAKNDFDKPISKSFLSSSIVGTLLGPVATIALDVVNSAIAKKQQSYSANYSNSYSILVDSSHYDDISKGDYYLVFTRYGIDDDSDSEKGILNPADIMSIFACSFKTSTESSLQLKLSKIKLVYSKAALKKNDALAISIDLKISATASIPSATAKSSPSKPSSRSFSNSNTGSSSGSSDTTATGSNNLSSASGSLGESIIKIPLIKPNSDFVTVAPNNLLINDAFFSGIPKPSSNGNVLLTISATITEANLNHLTPSTIDNLLKNNGSDITTFLKALLPSSSSSTANKSNSQ